MKTQPPLITDEQTLIGAKSRFGTPIPTYDDGFGQLYIHRDSMGISGIVRAQTWEDAYSICEDEFFPAATETEAEWIAEYGEEYEDDGCWQEAFGFRNNSRREEDGSLSFIYAKDLNGDSLDLLTPELLAELEITLDIETPADPEEEIRWFAWHQSWTLNPNGRSVFLMSGRYGAKGSAVSRRHLFRPRIPRHSHYSPNCDMHAVNWES